uniref:Uncharacterized protein n=1 Tax=Rhizophora mucronata TaxID=61149 RepID=A0A2P2ISA4_RHIMU
MQEIRTPDSQYSRTRKFVVPIPCLVNDVLLVSHPQRRRFAPQVALSRFPLPFSYCSQIFFLSSSSAATETSA